MCSSDLFIRLQPNEVSEKLTSGRLIYVNNANTLVIRDKEGRRKDSGVFFEQIPDVNMVEESQGNLFYRKSDGNWGNLASDPDSGKILLSNGLNQDLYWDPGNPPDGNGIFDSNNIGASVSSNYIITLTDNLDINSTLFISDKLGVGTNTPIYLLSIGTTSNNQLELVNGSGSVYINTKDDVTGTLIMPQDSGSSNGELLLNDGQGNLYFGSTPSLSLSAGYLFFGNFGFTQSYAIGREIYGDITLSFTGSTLIGDNRVSYDKMQTVSTASFLGNTFSGGGNVTEIPILTDYIDIGGSASINLENPSNWENGAGGQYDYIGPVITDTAQGQKHFFENYYYIAVDDNLWIRVGLTAS